MLVVALMYDEKKGVALFNLNISRPATTPVSNSNPVHTHTSHEEPKTQNNENE